MWKVTLPLCVQLHLLHHGERNRWRNYKQCTRILVDSNYNMLKFGVDVGGRF